jgi:hypothetical protein
MRICIKFIYGFFLQLQEAYAKGLVKPGLNIVSIDQKKHYANDVVSKKREMISITC